MREIADDPPVALINEVDEEAVEEEADDDQARAVVTAAFHYRVHFRISIITKYFLKTTFVEVIF